MSDARLLEIEFLSRLSRSKSLILTRDDDIPRRDLIAYLIMEGLAEDATGPGWPSMTPTSFAQSATYLQQKRAYCFGQFLCDQPVVLCISHKGRVRLAELEQALKTGRDREPFGILLGARYWERDLRIALLSASKESPVALCFLDMNGLKAINDSRGHECGNDAIRTFLRVVAANVEGTGDAYRYGGDEVIVILPDTNEDVASKLMSSLLNQLAAEKLEGVETLTASCGIGVATDPELDPKAFSQAVDATQYKAKEASKHGPKRRSVLAIEGGAARVL